MTIVLSPNTWSITPYQQTLDSRAPAGTPLPTPNVAPVLVDYPATISYTGTGPHTFSFAPYASDANDDAITYSLTTTRTGITIHSTTGLLTVTSAADDTTGDVVVQVSDGLLTNSYTVRVSVTTTTAGAKRWNPGHWIKTQGADSRTDRANYWSVVFSGMDQAEAFAPIKGCFVNVAWGSFNTTGSTYDWTELDALFARAVSQDLKLIIPITYKNFEGTVGLIAPADLIAANTYATSSGWITAVWRPAVMTRFIAAVQAFADRYKDHPNLEAVSWSESAPSLNIPSPPADYTRSALSTQLQALTVAAAPMFPDNWVLICVNSLGGQLTQMINAGFTAGAGFSTPDAVDTNGIRIFRGETVSGELVPTNGDLRGRMMHEEIVSSAVLGGRDDNGPATNVIDWAQANDVTHLSWITTDASPGCTWTDIKAAITTDPLLHSAYPTG